MHTTNYFNTFISVADDCLLQEAKVPLPKGDKKTVAGLQFDALIDAPYRFTSDEVLFAVHALRQGIPDAEKETARAEFFSKGQPCFRASPLTKQHGWGLHCDEAGRIALYAVESEEYKTLSADERLKQVKAMRTKRV